MSSRVSIQQFVSNTEPAGVALGDEWYVPSTGLLYKRTAVNGTQTSWVNIAIVPSGSGILSIAGTANAVSTTTGALQVAGGVGIGGNLYVGGVVVGGGVRNTTSSLPPSNPTVGDIWYNSSADVIYRYTDNGSGSSVWLDINGPGVPSSPATTLQASIYNRTKQSLTPAAGTATIDFNSGSAIVLTLTNAITGWSFLNVPTSSFEFEFRLYIVINGGSISAWPTGTKWALASAPTLTTTAGKIDVLSFTTYDGGTSWLGMISGQTF